MAVSLTHTTVAVGTDAGNGEIAKAQWNENHTLTAAVDNLLGTTSLSTSVVEIPCTAAGRALLDDADAAAQRTTLSAAGTGVSNTFTSNQIISVTDNTNAALRITQLGTGNAILVEDATNPDATPFVVDSSGVVVIGSTTPESTLSNSFLQLIGDNAAANAYFMRYQTSSSASGNLTFAKSNGTKDAKTIVASGDRLGNLQFAGYDGSAFSNAAQIRAEVDGTPGAGDMPGRLVLATSSDGSSAPTERVRIRSDGNIGIGGVGYANASLSIQKSITGSAFAFGASVEANIQSDVNSVGSGFNTFLGTAAASFSVNLSHYRTSQGTFGAGSTVNTQYGFHSTGSLIGANENIGFGASDTAAVTSGKIAYGFFSAINTATGGGTTYGFYAAGTALNYFGGQVQLAAGSQTSAALARSSDPNTGLFFPAADTVAFTTGGTERLRINSTGQVGINVTPTAEFDLNGNYAANVVAVAALDIDCGAGNYFTKTINGASTFTFSNAPASRAYSFTLELTHTSGAVTWPAAVKWPGDTTPSLTTGKTHLFFFVTDDGGTRWRGSSLVNYTN